MRALPRSFLVSALLTLTPLACSLVTGEQDAGVLPHEHNHSHGGAAGAGGGGEPDPPTLSCGKAAASCSLIECEASDAGGNHVATCSELSPHTNPVTSGPHYPVWAEFGVYEEPIPEGFLLHSLEHSAVALLYNCELVEAAGGDCSKLVTQLENFYESFPEDPLCGATPHRLIVAPSDRLDVPFAAAAWRYHLKGECFDEKRVSQFIVDHYGMNYENLCDSGIDPFSAGCQ